MKGLPHRLQSFSRFFDLGDPFFDCSADFDIGNLVVGKDSSDRVLDLLTVTLALWANSVGLHRELDRNEDYQIVRVRPIVGECRAYDLPVVQVVQERACVSQDIEDRPVRYEVLLCEFLPNLLRDDLFLEGEFLPVGTGTDEGIKAQFLDQRTGYFRDLVVSFDVQCV